MQQIEITLNKTYYNKPFFNLGKKNKAELIGECGQIIRLQLGLNGIKIDASINRKKTVNSNGTPRIYIDNRFQTTYLDWIQVKNYDLGNHMKVEIVNSTSLILHRKREKL